MRDIKLEKRIEALEEYIKLSASNIYIFIECEPSDEELARIPPNSFIVYSIEGESLIYKKYETKLSVAHSLPKGTRGVKISLELGEWDNEQPNT